MATSPEARLKELNLTLPSPGRPMARYKMAVRAGNMLYVVNGRSNVGANPQGCSHARINVAEIAKCFSSYRRSSIRSAELASKFHAQRGRGHGHVQRFGLAHARNRNDLGLQRGHGGGVAV